jgi:hypothetical protein
MAPLCILFIYFVRVCAWSTAGCWPPCINYLFSSDFILFRGVSHDGGKARNIFMEETYFSFPEFFASFHLADLGVKGKRVVVDK